MDNLLRYMLDPHEVNLVERLMQSLGFVRFCALIRAVAEFLSRIARLPFRYGEISPINVHESPSGAPNAASVQRTRSHSSAFPELADGCEVDGKRVRLEGEGDSSIATSNDGKDIRIENVDDLPCMIVAPEVGNEDIKQCSDNRDVEDVAGLLDLPYDVLSLVADRTGLLTRNEQMSIMHSCTFWNGKLGRRYLEEAGLSKALPAPHQSHGLLSRTTLAVRGSNAYLALMYWRRSEYFHYIDTIQFHFSDDDASRNTQLSCLANFLASLSTGVCHFRTVHMFLSDYERGVDLPLLSNVLYNLHLTGCVDFWIYSSWFAELGVSDEERDWPVILHTMERVSVQSSAMFSKALLPWFTRTLESGSSLSSIDVSSSGMTREQWSSLLPRVFLPRLQSIRAVGIDLSTLASFLVRHPFVRKVRLDGVYVDDVENPSQLSLPKLDMIEGDEHRISRFLHLLDPSIRLDRVTFVFRNDCNSILMPRVFDAEAFSSVLCRVGELQGVPSTFNINVDSDSGFLSFMSSRKPDVCPEGLLSLYELNINIFGSDPRDLLDGCVIWVSLFSAITNLKIWVEDGVVDEIGKENYKQAFGNVRNDACVRFL